MNPPPPTEHNPFLTDLLFCQWDKFPPATPCKHTHTKLSLVEMFSLGFQCLDVSYATTDPSQMLCHSCQFFVVCLFPFSVSLQLRESFKDIKKKFNNLKFNYMKKNEKLRNMKAVKNQLQQIDIYLEKLQVRRVSTLSQAFECYIQNNSLNEGILLIVNSFSSYTE